MEILQIVGIGVIAAILAVVLKEQKPIFAFLVTVLAGAIIFFYIADQIWKVLYVLEKIVFQASIDLFYFETIVKIIGIAYIAEFGAQITRDAGEGAIASKIEMAGKILILIMAIPIIQAILETIIRLLPTS